MLGLLGETYVQGFGPTRSWTIYINMSIILEAPRGILCYPLSQVHQLVNSRILRDVIFRRQQLLFWNSFWTCFGRAKTASLELQLGR